MALVPHGAGGSTVSLSCPMLTPANYTVWAIKVEAILDGQGVWEAVSPGDGVEVDEAKNKMARARLLGALSEDILMQVSTKKTAKEALGSLKTFEERSRRHAHAVGERSDGQLLLTAVATGVCAPGRVRDGGDRCLRARSSP